MTIKGLVAAPGALLMALVVLAGPTFASETDTGTDYELTPGSGDVEVGANQESTDQSDGDQGGSSPVLNIPEPFSTYKYAPDCDGSTVTAGGVLQGDDGCLRATAGCEDDEYRFKVFALEHTADGTPDDEGYQFTGSECRSLNDLDEGGPVQITLADIAEQARKAAPETVVNVEPVDRSYVNLPTNFYADSGAADATVTVLGQDIGLTFQPSGFAWSYGDGASGDGAGAAGSKVGAPGAVEHAYRRSGEVSVTLTRTFEVTYALPGGQTGTLPAPGVSNSSDPYPLEIREIQATVTETG